MVESPAALNVARRALKLIQSSDRGSIPPPNDRDRLRVAAHLADFKVEAEFRSDRADSFVNINHNGELVLRAHIVPIWEGQRRTDNIELVEVHETGWFSGFLQLARASGAPPVRSAKRQPHKAPTKRRPRTKRITRSKRVGQGRGKAHSRAKAKARRWRSTSANSHNRSR